MIAVIDHGAGNLRNVCKALEYVGTQPVLTSDVVVLQRADKIVLPGVGAFADCLSGLKQRGLYEPLRDLALNGKPLLGICVGMQLLFDIGEEMGTWHGLGLIHGSVRRFQLEHISGDSNGNRLKVPHIGWNEVMPVRDHPLMTGIKSGGYAYFVHSYHPVAADPTDVVAYTNYGYDFASVVAHGNIWGIQFHPEKSQNLGLHMLRNFVEAD
jgi:glutamine amidotransferase